MSDGEPGKQQKPQQDFMELIRARKEAKKKQAGEGVAEPNGPQSISQKIVAKFQARKELREKLLVKGLTLEALQGAEDEELGPLVMDYLSKKIKDAEVKGEVLIEWVGKLPLEFRAVYVSTVLYGEVGNGGFAAVYYNSTKEFESYFAEAFELMGAVGYSEIVRRAIELHRRGETEALSALDREFYALGRTKQFNELQGRFIRGRMEKFAVD